MVGPNTFLGQGACDDVLEEVMSAQQLSGGGVGVRVSEGLLTSTIHLPKELATMGKVGVSG